MVIAVIDEFNNTDASCDVRNSIEDVNDFFVSPSTAAAVNSLDLSSAEITDREIKVSKTRTVPFLKDKRILSKSVLCIFSLGWVSWRGVYLPFLHLQQLPSACFHGG